MSNFVDQSLLIKETDNDTYMLFSLIQENNNIILDSNNEKNNNIIKKIKQLLLGKEDMVNNHWMPNITVNSQTYEVHADGKLLTCEPLGELPLAQLYQLF